MERRFLNTDGEFLSLADCVQAIRERGFLLHVAENAGEIYRATRIRDEDDWDSVEIPTAAAELLIAQGTVRSIRTIDESGMRIVVYMLAEGRA